jgi:tetratricopeptide (TPR) repeat protein
VATCLARLGRGDEQGDSLRRVKLLSPGNPEDWYLCGAQELRAGRRQDAWASWRHSLGLSGAWLPEVVARAAEVLGPEQIVAEVLPDNPEELLAAALGLYPDPGAVPERRPFLDKALALLGANAGTLTAEDLRLEALVHKALDQPEPAVEAYREAVAREPWKVPWRYEFARYLYDLRRLEESRRELTVVLAQDPGNGAARALLDTVTHDLLQEKWEGGRQAPEGPERNPPRGGKPR